FKDQVYETLWFTEEEAVVRVTSVPILCTNRYIRIPEIGRSIIWRGEGVEAEFGRLRIQYKPFRRQRLHLDSGQRLREFCLNDAQAFSLDTEGFLLWVAKGLSDYETELLGAALVRAAATELGVDPGALTCWYERRGQRLVMVDEGGPTGFAKQVWEALPTLLPLVRTRLETCPCRRRGCPRCVDLRSLKSAPLVVTWKNLVEKLREVYP
ncbi:MAG: Zn-binding domain-containing protein, partial [Candidatus Heimdallarchaeota archaeon]